MAGTTRPAPPRLTAGRLRLASGWVLFAFVTTHLSNHALGLVSLSAMEEGRWWFLALWRNPLGTVMLYGALLTHVTLALRSLYRRRHLRMPGWEATQLAVGLLIPPLLVSHVVGTRLAHAWFDADDPYGRVALTLWQLRPDLGLRQTIVVLAAWVHGCIGLHFWLRLRPSYAAVAPTLLGIAVLVPALALLGFAAGGREAAARASSPEAVAAVLAASNAPDAAEREALARVTDALLVVIGAGLAGVVVGREVRRARARRRLHHVSYPGGERVAIEPGTTVLEASRLAGVPHASVCGGRGRCSTCRVRIVDGLERLAPAAPAELRVLERVAAPPNVRLACQLRPTTDVFVVPLLPVSATVRDGAGPAGFRAGQEREVAVLFADLRRFTRLTERRLPYDVVFLLNRYFAVVGAAIERSGGIANQFTGDGVMALFGVDATPDRACRDAVAAAAEIARGVEALSRELTAELPAPLRIGIGIHAGPAVVGHMGYGVARYLTAVGDTVHVASRLQDLTKEYDCELIVSRAVVERAGLDAGALPRHELSVRNRAEPVVVHVVADARGLALPP
jgi:adenylate cyclase